MGCRSVWMGVGFFWQMARNEDQFDLHIALVLYKNGFFCIVLLALNGLILGLKGIGLNRAPRQEMTSVIRQRRYSL
jgi:hypothetical protein